MILRRLNELLSKKQVTKISDFWEENKDLVKRYRDANLYLGRELDGGSRIEIFKATGDRKNRLGVFSVSHAKQRFAPIRTNQNPDAEGFITYIDKTRIEAFQYNGEDLKLDLDDGGITKIQKGDYVVFYADDHPPVFTLVDSTEFDSLYEVL